MRLRFDEVVVNRRSRSLRDVVCFAVDDDVREKELGISVGSAVEDRPGKCITPQKKRVSFFFL